MLIHCADVSLVKRYDTDETAGIVITLKNDEKYYHECDSILEAKREFDRIHTQLELYDSSLGVYLKHDKHEGPSGIDTS